VELECSTITPKNHVNIGVNGSEVQSIIDTGSACTILSSRLFYKIRKSSVIKRHYNYSQGLTLFSADSSPMKVITVLDVEIQIPGIKF
jgi:hypothetical protein